MYAATPLLGRAGLLDSPTTAIVRALLRISGMLFDIQLQYPPKFLDFFGRQYAPAPGRKIQLEESDLHAAQLFHQPAEMFEHHADLILPALRDFYFIPGIRGAL